LLWCQEALEHVADAVPGCRAIAVVPHARHLLFLKDYLSLPRVLLWDRQWPTFVHVTAANRIETQDAVYVALATHLHAALGFRSPFQKQPTDALAPAAGDGDC
jgi:hypothetical protein